MTAAGTFAVLFVCTGNICRSPTAERLFLAGLLARLGTLPAGLAVSSAGTWGVEGALMEPHAVAAVQAGGGNADGFRARQLTSGMIAAADLVLTATREHRGAVATLVPRAAARTFTICEFDRLCRFVGAEDLPATFPERAAALVVAAAASRGLAPPLASPADDDLPDPYGGRAALFTASATAITRALATPLDLLAGSAASAQPGRALR